MEILNPQKKIIPFGVFFYNLALIHFASVSFNFIDEKKDKGYLSDLNDSLEVSLIGGIKGLGRKEIESLENGMRLYSPVIAFKPENKDVWLNNYKTEGPPVLDKGKKSALEFLKGISPA